MASKISSLRLDYELSEIHQDLSSQSRNLKPNILMINPDYSQGFKNLSKWEVLIQGRRNDSPYAEGLYFITFSFDENFPISPPKIHFEPGFMHIHVYREDGRICLPLVNENNWSSKYEMIEVINQVEELIHAEPRVASPANDELLKLYLSNKEQFNDVIREQTEKTKKKFMHLLEQLFKI